MTQPEPFELDINAAKRLIAEVIRLAQFDYAELHKRKLVAFKTVCRKKFHSAIDMKEAESVCRFLSPPCFDRWSGCLRSE